MFHKKVKCTRCHKDVDKKFDFCPYCASALKDMKKEYGMLGRTDDVGELDRMFNNSLASNSGNSLFEKMFTGAMKMVEKELQKSMSEDMKIRQEKSIPAPNNVHSHVELFINGKKVNLPPNIAGIQIERVPQQGDSSSPHQQKQVKRQAAPKVSEETLQKSAKLPRKEAKTKLVRTSDKIIYELDTPGISSLNNVLVNQLENSIEVRAYTDKTVFFKTLSIKLPLMQYTVNPTEGKLILEFKTQ